MSDLNVLNIKTWSIPEGEAKVVSIDDSIAWYRDIVLEKLNTPEISIDDGVLLISKIDERAETLAIYVDGVQMAIKVIGNDTTETLKFDLADLSLPAGTYEITVNARGGGYANSDLSDVAHYVIEAADMVVEGIFIIGDDYATREDYLYSGHNLLDSNYSPACESDGNGTNTFIYDGLECKLVITGMTKNELTKPLRLKAGQRLSFYPYLNGGVKTRKLQYKLRITEATSSRFYYNNNVVLGSDALWRDPPIEFTFSYDKVGVGSVLMVDGTGYAAMAKDVNFFHGVHIDVAPAPVQPQRLNTPTIQCLQHLLCIMPGDVHTKTYKVYLNDKYMTEVHVDNALKTDDGSIIVDLYRNGAAVSENTVTVVACAPGYVDSYPSAPAVYWEWFDVPEMPEETPNVDGPGNFETNRVVPISGSFYLVRRPNVTWLHRIFEYGRGRGTIKFYSKFDGVSWEEYTEISAPSNNMLKYDTENAHYLGDWEDSGFRFIEFRPHPITGELPLINEAIGYWLMGNAIPLM